MTRPHGAYVVHDENAGVKSGNVHKLFPYTLKGLTDALEEARSRSSKGPPQVVVVMADSGRKIIRRYHRGREIPPEAAPGLRGTRWAGTPLSTTRGAERPMAVRPARTGPP